VVGTLSPDGDKQNETKKTHNQKYNN